MFILIIMFLILNVRFNPFAFVTLNRMESLSLITSLMTIYCGLFYIADIPEDVEVKNNLFTSNIFD